VTERVTQQTRGSLLATNPYLSAWMTSPEDPYGHEADMPSVRDVAQDLARWEDALVRLSRIVDAARVAKKRISDAHHDVDGWKYTSAEPGSKEDVPCDEERCLGDAKGSYYSEEASLTLCDQCFPRRREIASRLSALEAETWVDIVVRARSEEEWFFHEHADERVALSDVDCLFGCDSCWFYGNQDRLGEYGGSWRLSGTSGMIAMCEICWNNNGIEEDDVAERIRQCYSGR
jgi:hypothetical protein